MSITSDKLSKEFRPRYDFPRVANANLHTFHTPLISSLPLFGHRKNALKRPKAVTLAQREQGHHAKLAGSSTWQRFAQAAVQTIDRPWS